MGMSPKYTIVQPILHADIVVLPSNDPSFSKNTPAKHRENGGMRDCDVCVLKRCKCKILCESGNLFQQCHDFDGSVFFGSQDINIRITGETRPVE